MKTTLIAIALVVCTVSCFGQTLLHSALAKIDRKDFRGAIADCDKAIKASPYLGESYQIRGTAKVAIGDYMGAIKDCNKAIEYKAGPEFLAAAYTWRGTAKYQLGDRKSACDDWRRGGEMGNSTAYTFISNYCN